MSGALSVLQQCLGRQRGQQADVSYTLQGILELSGVVRGDRPAQGWKDLVPGSLETVRAESITVSSHHKTVRGIVGAVRCGHHVCCVLMPFFHLCRVPGRKGGIRHSCRAGSAQGRGTGCLGRCRMERYVDKRQ